MLPKSAIRGEIEKMCTQLGANPLLVQGAGGNVSWKEEEILWVKASGTWLSDASVEDIFLPTDLPYIRTAISEGRFDVTPLVKNETSLRPSIETLIHALMPQRVVLHLHAIDVLSHLVRADCDVILKKMLPKNFSFVIVDYCKPGADLARSVYNKIQSDEVSVVFLLNHGLVIAGESVGEVSATLNFILENLKSDIYVNDPVELPIIGLNTIKRLKRHGYIPAKSSKFNALAVNSNLSYIVEKKWAMFPDHVVFLGPKALIGDYDFLENHLASNENSKPAFIFCKGVGTFQHNSLSRAQLDQLSCFYDVAIRQKSSSKIVVLSPHSIADLLDWDAEVYRQAMSK